MKFISVTMQKNKPFVFEAPLEVSLLRQLTRDGDILTTNFNVAMTVPSLPYFQDTNMDLIIEISGENIYVTAILYVGIEKCDSNFRHYETDGMVPFNVILTEEEKRKILIYFIKNHFMI